MKALFTKLAALITTLHTLFAAPQAEVIETMAQCITALEQKVNSPMTVRKTLTVEAVRRVVPCKLSADEMQCLIDAATTRANKMEFYNYCQHVFGSTVGREFYHRMREYWEDLVAQVVLKAQFAEAVEEVAAPVVAPVAPATKPAGNRAQRRAKPVSKPAAPKAEPKPVVEEPKPEVKTEDGMVEWTDTLGRKCRAPYVMDRETYGLYRDCLEHGGRVMKDLHWPTVQEFRITSWDMLLTMIVNKQTMAIVPYVLSLPESERLAYAKAAGQDGDVKLSMPGYKDGAGMKNPSNISNFYSHLVGRDGMVGMYPAVHVMDDVLAATRQCHVRFGEFVPAVAGAQPQPAPKQKTDTTTTEQDEVLLHAFDKTEEVKDEQPAKPTKISRPKKTEQPEYDCFGRPTKTKAKAKSFYECLDEQDKQPEEPAKPQVPEVLKVAETPADAAGKFVLPEVVCAGEDYVISYSELLPKKANQKFAEKRDSFCSKYKVAYLKWQEGDHTLVCKSVVNYMLVRSLLIVGEDVEAESWCDQTSNGQGKIVWNGKACEKQLATLREKYPEELNADTMRRLEYEGWVALYSDYRNTEIRARLMATGARCLKRPGGETKDGYKYDAYVSFTERCLMVVRDCLRSAAK